MHKTMFSSSCEKKIYTGKIYNRGDDQNTKYVTFESFLQLFLPLKMLQKKNALKVSEGPAAYVQYNCK